MPTEPAAQAASSTAPAASGPGRGPSIDLLAYTCAIDLTGEPYQALSLTRDLLKKVSKSGLKSPFSEALLRRLALGEWAKLDRPRPKRLESTDPKESAIILFFLTFWGVTYDDLSVALQVTEERARHLVHRARMEQIAATARIPIPKADCRRPREVMSDYLEGLLDPVLAEEVRAHLSDCRDCSMLESHMDALLKAPPRPLLEPPTTLQGGDVARPLPSIETGSKNKRRAGIALLILGLGMGAVQLNPSWNAAASAQLDRMSAVASRWRSRGQRLMEDMKVLRALAMGTVEGRTEELSQTLDDYVNADKPGETGVQKNKDAPAAVLDSRDPKNQSPDPKATPKSSGAASPKPQPSGSPGPAAKVSKP